MQKQTKDKRGLKIVLIFFCVAIVTMALSIVIATLFQRLGGGGTSEPEEEVVVKNDDKTVSMEYSGRITVNSGDGTIKFYFKNPARSQKSVRLEAIGEIDGEEVVLFKTDKIAPGEKIEEARYESEEELKVGNYDGKFVVHFYGENGIEEIVNSEILVKVVVK